MLSCLLPQAKPPSLKNNPAHANQLPAHLNGQKFLFGCGFTVSGLFHDVRSADICIYYPSSKKSEHFLLEQDLG